MKQHPFVKKAGKNGDITEFIIEEGVTLGDLKPAGRMITDTDTGTFVYLLDDGEQFINVHFPQETWPVMADALAGGTDPVLTDGSGRVELTRFTEELDMLIFNIEGNDNYGETFSSAVEKAFQQILGAE